jgi:hypothetical protein
VARGPTPAAPALLEEQDFVRDRVWPLISGGHEFPAASFALSVHRRRADGRTVAEYRFGEATRVFAKLYPHPLEGAGVHRIHDRLWNGGFGLGSRNRVPEPLAYLEECGVLLLRAAPGGRLAGIEAHDWDAFEDGVGRASRWLAALHASSVSIGPRETLAHGVFRLARRAAKATAARPDLENVVHGALAELDRRCARAAGSGVHVQTHGRFHPGHVFVAPECITAVDLDRAARADPAKDVAEFIHGLRSIGARMEGVNDEVEAACARFLAEYVPHTPVAPSGLVYYWSYSVLWTLLGLTFKDRPARPGWKERVDFFQGEFEEVPRRAAGWLRGPKGPSYSRGS